MNSPDECGMLDVAGGQKLYWEQWGAPDGLPALYLHGGPGGGLGRSGYRHQFDLERVRVIGFDQRGCGRSIPHASNPSTKLDRNTTADLIRDIEALREARGVDRWIINGVSWGSTLALAYAQEHPERVIGIVLFAVTTTSRAYVDWITEGVGQIFPEAWDRFSGHAQDAGIGYRRGEGRLVQAYSALLNSADFAVRNAASKEWALWEDTHVSIGSGTPSSNPRWEDDDFRIAFARLTSHYWANNGFLDPPILEGMERLRGIPGILIHGRRDVSGPTQTAWRLHKEWPKSELIVIEEEGHGGELMVEQWRLGNQKLCDLADNMDSSTVSQEGS